MEKKDVKIDKMVLNIEGEKVSLTMEQAKKLKSLLDDLFGKEIVKEVVEKHHYHDWYYRPYVWYAINTTQETPVINYNKVYCNTSSQALEVTL